MPDPDHTGPSRGPPPERAPELRPVAQAASPWRASPPGSTWYDYPGCFSGSGWDHRILAVRLRTLTAFGAGDPKSTGTTAPGAAPIAVGRGTLVGLDGVGVPARGEGLTLSDLVLGRTGSTLTWWTGAERIPLNPLNTVPRRAPVVIYYELGGLVAGGTYRTEIAIYKCGDERRRARFRLEFRETAAAPFQTIRRTLGIERLTQGTYDLEVTVRPPERSGRAVRRQVV